MHKTIEPDGRLDAPIIPIGEAPANNEMIQGRPFVGASGNRLKVWWAGAGLSREHMRIMNVLDSQAPGNEIDKAASDRIVEGIVELHNRIAKLTDPFVLVPMGNYATYALTGKGKVKAAVRNALEGGGGMKASEAEKKAGITKLRGSLYSYTDLNGREIKVIPTIHPAATFRTQKWEKRCIVDWKKIARESQFKDIYYRPREHIIDPSEEEVAAFCQEVLANQRVLSVDIETWGHKISCVGFADGPERSITVPTLEGQDGWGWVYVKALCESHNHKILQNGFYDLYWLAGYGVKVENFIWDTMLMHHAIDPVESHSLDFLSSIYLPDHVYWKDEAKDADEIVKYAHDLDALWVYNGLDCCRTFEIWEVLCGLLEKKGLMDFYFEHYQRLFVPLVETMLHGVRVDTKAQKTWAKQLRAEMKEIREYLAVAAGEDLFASEQKLAYREPKRKEWEELLKQEPLDWDCVPVPKPKEINKEIARQLGYVMTGKNAGMIKEMRVKFKKDFSPKKLHGFFYGTLKLPKQVKMVKKQGGKDFTVTLDENAVRKMTAKFPEKIKDYGTKLLAYREKKKELDYLKGAWDADERIRCAYKMTTEAGRLSSAKNPMGRGYNLQNIKR